MDIEKLHADLIRDEGRVAHAYLDSEGLLTIGVGHLVDESAGGGLPEDLVDILLAYDVATVCDELDREAAWWRGLKEPAQRALCNMCFNLGWPRLATFQKMLTALQLHDYDTAALEALDSKWAKQVGERAWRVADLYRSPA